MKPLASEYRSRVRGSCSDDSSVRCCAKSVFKTHKRTVRIFRSLFVTFNNGGRAKMLAPSGFSLGFSIASTPPVISGRLSNVWCPLSGLCGLRLSLGTRMIMGCEIGLQNWGDGLGLISCFQVKHGI